MFLYVRNSIQFYLRNRAPKQHAAKVEEIKKQASSTHTRGTSTHINTFTTPPICTLPAPTLLNHVGFAGSNGWEDPHATLEELLQPSPVQGRMHGRFPY